MARKPKQIKEIEFDFIKSNFFRVVHADGAIGGLSANGNIHMALYNERRAIPTKVVHAVQGTALGAEIRDRRQSRDSFVREVEVDVVLGVEQAAALAVWLQQKIDDYNKNFAAAVVASAKKNRKK